MAPSYLSFTILNDNYSKLKTFPYSLSFLLPLTRWVFYFTWRLSDTFYSLQCDEVQKLPREGNTMESVSVCWGSKPFAKSTNTHTHTYAPKHCHATCYLATWTRCCRVGNIKACTHPVQILKEIDKVMNGVAHVGVVVGGLFSSLWLKAGAQKR